jgi:hypothetical protein
MTASVIKSPAWLTSQLKSIYPTSLVGLWVGEDLVVDGSNNVTSWPGRVGPTLNATGANFVTTNSGGRKYISNSAVDVKRNLSATVSAYKGVFAVARATTIPFPDYKLLVNGAVSSPLLGYPSLSQWVAGWTQYDDGVQTIAATTDLSVYLSTKADSAETVLNVGGTKATGAYETWNWLGLIGCVVLTATVPTTLQRLQTQFVLDSYYRPEQAPAAKLALDLYQLLGASITELYVGEDLVITGSSNVASWPGRVGAPLMPVGVLSSMRTVNSRKSMYKANIEATDVGYFKATSAALTPKSVWAVCKGPAAGSGGTYRTLTELVGGTGEYPLVRDQLVDTWYDGGWTRYMNGVSSLNTRIENIATYEATKASPATNNTTFRVGCEPSAPAGAWLWDKLFFMNLSDIPSAKQRVKTQLALCNYYRLDQPPALHLANDLLNILGDSLTGLWVGEDLVVDGSNNVTSWPGRVGPTLSNTGTGFWNGSTLNNRKALIGTGSSQGCLYSAMSAPQTLIAVAQTPALPFATYEIIARTNATSNTNGFCGNNGTSAWLEPDPPYTATRYLDGVASTAITSGTHVWETYAAGDTTASVAVGYAYSTNNFSWQAPVGCVIALSAGISSDQRALATQILRGYYGL